jgi:hypothetical protein
LLVELRRLVQPAALEEHEAKEEAEVSGDADRRPNSGVAGQEVPLSLTGTA